MTGSGSRDRENLPAINTPITLSWSLALDNHSAVLILEATKDSSLDGKAGKQGHRDVLLVSPTVSPLPLLAFWGGDMNYKIIRPRFLEVLVCYITPFRGSPEGLEHSLCP